MTHRSALSTDSSHHSPFFLYHAPRLGGDSQKVACATLLKWIDPADAMEAVCCTGQGDKEEK